MEQALWARPEDMTQPRPSCTVSLLQPGTDVMASAVAALAATSVALQVRLSGHDLQRMRTQRLLLHEDLQVSVAVSWHHVCMHSKTDRTDTCTCLYHVWSWAVPACMCTDARCVQSLNSAFALSAMDTAINLYAVAITALGSSSVACPESVRPVAREIVCRGHQAMQTAAAEVASMFHRGRPYLPGAAGLWLFGSTHQLQSSPTSLPAAQCRVVVAVVAEPAVPADVRISHKL